MVSKQDALLTLGIVLCTTFFWKIEGEEMNVTRDSLNSFLYTHVLQSIPKIRTGTLYGVTPPTNMSGVTIFVVRLRAHRLWMDGANLSSTVEIPPKTTLPRPFTRRMDIVYHNLGNLSTYYYDNDIFSGHTLVAPVISLLAYNSYNTTSNAGSGVIDLGTEQSNNNNTIVIHFPISEELRSVKCVRFDTNGTFETSDVGPKMTCRTMGSGHFSLVIPQEGRKRKKKGIEGWKVGVIIGGGIVGLLVMGVIGYKLWKWRKVRRMESVTERSEGLGTMWIGDARMPIAQGMRTLPLLENNYVP